MPTTARLYTQAEQDDQRAKLLVRAASVDVWECVTACGVFWLRKREKRYYLSGGGVRLFAADPNFGEIPIDATCDADAVRQVQRQIADRWADEHAHMLRAFEVYAGGSAEPVADPDGTVDLDDLRRAT
jgi:hypothetical protein